MTVVDTVHMLARVKWNEPLWTTLQMVISAATDDGDLYADRLPNTGEESVVWIGSNVAPRAFALFYEARPRVMWIDQLFVEPEYRRGGMAGRLLAAIEDHAKAMGYHAVEYATRDSNRTSRGLGARRGYDHVAVSLRLDITPPPAPLAAIPGLFGDDIPF